MIINVWTVRYYVLKAVELGRVNPNIVFTFTFEYACTHRPHARSPATVYGSSSTPVSPTTAAMDSSPCHWVWDPPTEAADRPQPTTATPAPPLLRHRAPQILRPNLAPDGLATHALVGGNDEDGVVLQTSTLLRLARHCCYRCRRDAGREGGRKLGAVGGTSPPPTPAVVPSSLCAGPPVAKVARGNRGQIGTRGQIERTTRCTWWGPLACGILCSGSGYIQRHALLSPRSSLLRGVLVACLMVPLRVP
jgi:hypothetical protein